MTQKLYTQIIQPDFNSLEEYTANRESLENETLDIYSRIIRKSVVNEIRPDIMESSGSLQLCGEERDIGYPSCSNRQGST